MDPQLDAFFAFLEHLSTCQRCQQVHPLAISAPRPVQLERFRVWSASLLTRPAYCYDGQATFTPKVAA